MMEITLSQYWKQLSLLVVFILLSSVSFQASAGKLYKIVDDEGNITFSQYPPAEKDEIAKIESMEKPNDGTTLVTEKYGAKYCGEKRLPTFGNYNRDTMLNQLDRFRKSAQQSLDYYEKNLDRLNDYDQRTYENDKLRRENAAKYRDSYLNDSNYKRSQDKYSSDVRKRSRAQREETLRQIRDLRCQVNWANGYQDEIYLMKSEAAGKISQLKETSDRINSEMAENCGSEPYYDPSDQNSSAKWKRWKECVRDYKKDLYHVDTRLYKEQRKIQ